MITVCKKKSKSSNIIKNCKKKVIKNLKKSKKTSKISFYKRSKSKKIQQMLQI